MYSPLQNVKLLYINMRTALRFEQIAAIHYAVRLHRRAHCMIHKLRVVMRGPCLVWAEITWLQFAQTQIGFYNP